MSTLIKVKNYKVLDMPSLTRAVLKSIYEPEKMKSEEITMMEHSFVKWNQNLQPKMQEPEELQSVIDQEYYFVLMKLAKLIDDNRNGRLEGRKAMIKRCGLDYRKLAAHRLPEAYTKADFVKARRAKAEYDKKNPEQEGLV